jgi:methylenetetrahydrofolate--tRNA-(uracil-5-)-methyltransferase
MTDLHKTIQIIGAGLAGCEAAWQAAERGVKVKLYEMKPLKYSPAHKSPLFSELVCSNSLRSNEISNAVGLLKEELRRCGSLIMEAADKTAVPAGSALAVDRQLFATYITDKIKSHANIEIFYQETTDIDTYNALPTVIATGPLTSDAFSKKIAERLGFDYLFFYDAAAPIIDAATIDKGKVYAASRYGKGEACYLNCPMNKDEYDVFYTALINAEEAPLKNFENLTVFEGCMPVEVMAKRGYDTLRFGPMKPVGLPDPLTGRDPYAVVQLRLENTAAESYNLVGFQTHLTFSEQKKVFRLIPGLENAEFFRYGVMHRNTFINSPKILDHVYSVNRSDISLPCKTFFAGQITGVEGYVESTSSGLVAGINAALSAQNAPDLVFPNTCMIGALAHYVSNPDVKKFQPMNANFGIIAPIDSITAREYVKTAKINKNNMREAVVNRALGTIDSINKQLIRS